MARPPCRMVAFQSPWVDRRGEIIERRAGQVEVYAENLDGVPLEMAAVLGGVFRMGSQHSPNADEMSQHLVSVRPFWLGRFPVTQAQWKAVMGRAVPWRFKGADLPVENITWREAREFCRKLSQQTGRTYRLPSEAEWEYACRAGTVTPFSTGETITTDLANYVGEYVFAEEPKGVYRHVPTPAGTFPPNPFGIYDMHGNLWELCADRWHPDYTGAPFDGQSWEHGGEAGYRVARGGSWHEPPANCRSAIRLRVKEDDHDDYYGFRVAATID